MTGFTATDVGDQSGRRFLVTGSNTGLGFEAALVLAQRGAHVVMACRNEAKGRASMARIEAGVPGAAVSFLALDLADLDSVRTAAKQVLAGPRLDVLINNAGVMIPPRTLTRQGFELQFGVNHLGTFAFTGLVHAHVDDRIVVTASVAHKSGRMDYSDLAVERGYSRWGRYGMSKLANLLHFHELDRRLRAAGRQTIALGCHPGGALTELSRHVPAALQWATPLAAPFFNTAAQGAWPTLQAATWDQAKGGDYFGPLGLAGMKGPSGPSSSSSAARDPALAGELWARSVALSGIDPGL